MSAEVYSYTKVKGIEIGDVINIYYDKAKDVVLIIEDKAGVVGTLHHTFGPKAEGLGELIDALQSYHQKKFNEREEVFDKVKKAINS